jgi:hypothetical protein
VVALLRRHPAPPMPIPCRHLQIAGILWVSVGWVEL